MTDPDPPKLDYASPESARPWVVARTFRMELEAEMTALVLRQQGFTCQVRAMGVYGPGTDRIELLVLASEQEAVNASLDDMDKRRQARLQAKVICEKCGGLALREMPLVRQAVGLSLAVAGLLLTVFLSPFFAIAFAAGLFITGWPFSPWWKCQKCNFRWRAPEPPEED